MFGECSTLYNAYSYEQHDNMSAANYVTSTNLIQFVLFADVMTKTQFNNLQNNPKKGIQCGYITTNNNISFTECLETKRSLCNFSNGWFDFEESLGFAHFLVCFILFNYDLFLTYY